MGRAFAVTEATEGAANLLVPDVPRRKGPGTAGPWPFYNPTMAVSRDVSAVVLARWPHPLRTVLDGLAATGAWGIRMALEAHAAHLTFNDRSIAAVDLTRENLQRNRVDADVKRGDLSDLLRRSHYDFVDIDPFGPPTPFLDAAFASARVRSGIGVTATDTAVLCGTYPEACRRRYGARSLRCDQGAEIGLRILLGFCARVAAEHGKTIRSILSFATEHFLRIFLTVEKDRGHTPMGFVFRRSPGEFVAVNRKESAAIGPLWLFPLHDAAVARRLAPSVWTSGKARWLLATFLDEDDLPPFFVTTDELAAREHGSPPNLEAFLEGLRAIGFRATRTHFHPRGVRTDAPMADVRRVFRERMPSGSTDGSGPAN